MDALREQEIKSTELSVGCYGRGISRIMPGFLTSLAKWTMLKDLIEVGTGREDKIRSQSTFSLKC